MSYVDIDGSMYSRNRSYELAPQQMSLYVTREELEDAKKELTDLRRKRFELIEEINREKKDSDERISADELQIIMFPVEIVDRRIKDLTYLISNAKIVEKASAINQEEIQEALIDALDDLPEQIVAGTETPAERIPASLFFVKDGAKVEAKTGDRTPFYALVDGEYMGYNRLLLNGWVLVDDSERQIDDISEAWDISKALSNKERSSFIQSAKDKYPNAFSPWTESENAKLLDLYSNQLKTISDISEILGRTKNGVSLQIKRLLGLERLPYRKKHKDLTEYSSSPISLTTINPSEISDKQMPEYLDLIEQMEEWFKYVKNYAEQQAIENGVYYEGYEIKTTYKNTCPDPKKIMETIQKRFPELYSSCIQLKTVSAIKKALGEDNYNSSIAELVVQEEQKTLVKSKL